VDLHKLAEEPTVPNAGRRPLPSEGQADGALVTIVVTPDRCMDVTVLASPLMLHLSFKALVPPRPTLPDNLVFCWSILVPSSLTEARARNS
jgi:hypothetical protein